MKKRWHQFLPRPIRSELRALRNAWRNAPEPRIPFSGDYLSWADAAKDASGYDTPQILQRVRASTVRVARGEAAFERDSVAFEQPQYRWPVVACLLRVALANFGKLHVVDFGGSLGSSYYQHRALLEECCGLLWSVVEQQHFVRCGQEEFENDRLRFFSTLNEAAQRAPIDIVLFSGVLQYLANPYETLRQAAVEGAPFLLIDRFALISGPRDLLTVQSVPPSIYEASFPHWFLSEQKFSRHLADLGYELEVGFEGRGDFHGYPCQEGGMLFERVDRAKAETGNSEKT